MPDGVDEFAIQHDSCPLVVVLVKILELKPMFFTGRTLMSWSVRA